MCIDLDKSKQKNLRHNSAIFVLEQNIIKMTPQKMGKIIGVSEVDFYSEIDFKPLYSKNPTKKPKKFTMPKKG